MAQNICSKVIEHLFAESTRASNASTTSQVPTSSTAPRPKAVSFADIAKTLKNSEADIYKTCSARSSGLTFAKPSYARLTFAKPGYATGPATSSATTFRED